MGASHWLQGEISLTRHHCGVCIDRNLEISPAQSDSPSLKAHIILFCLKQSKQTNKWNFLLPSITKLNLESLSILCPRTSSLYWHSTTGFYVLVNDVQEVTEKSDTSTMSHESPDSALD